MSKPWEFEDSEAVILIIDDEISNLKLLDKMLSRVGYNNIFLVQDPRDAIRVFLDQRPDLILLDLNMPYINGLEVIERLKTLDTPLLPPIMVLTAQNSREHLLQSFEKGARDFLTKPFDFKELQARVKNMLELHFAQKILSDQAAALDELVRQRTKELARTRLQIIDRLGRAAEFRDNETGNHVKRMSIFSELICKGLGWSEADCELMRQASPMHDVGKIGIPDHILLKSGKLTDDEFEIMKTHTEIGAKLLGGEDSDLLVLAKKIALAHHEKWDGSGYPIGLKGEEIPIEARIVSVSDVFDALTSVRPYKKAWPFDDAVKEIERGVGAHFDPEIVSAFLSVLPEIRAVYEKFSDSNFKNE